MPLPTKSTYPIDFGNGRPGVPEKTQKSNMRYAPRFARGCSLDIKEHPYTDQTIADFLGWVQPDGQPSRRVRNALSALEAIEEGLVKPAQFRGLSSEQAKTKTSAIRYAPGFRRGTTSVINTEVAYTDATVADFLGWIIALRDIAADTPALSRRFRARGKSEIGG